MATKRMRRRYNKRSRKGGEGQPVNFGMVNIPDDESKYRNSLATTNTGRSSFGSDYSTDTGRSSFGSDYSDNYPPEQTPRDLQIEYQSKCKKNFLGFKDSSPECKALEEKYKQLRGDVMDQIKEDKELINYQGYAPPKKAWYQIFGGRRKSRRYRKKRTVRRRRTTRRRR